MRRWNKNRPVRHPVRRSKKLDLSRRSQDEPKTRYEASIEWIPESDERLRKKFPIVSPLPSAPPSSGRTRAGIKKKWSDFLLSAEKRTLQREASIGGPMGYTIDVCGKHRPLCRSKWSFKDAQWKRQSNESRKKGMAPAETAAASTGGASPCQSLLNHFNRQQQEKTVGLCNLTFFFLGRGDSNRRPEC
jgi:hypothetical protein